MNKILPYFKKISLAALFFLFLPFLHAEIINIDSEKLAFIKHPSERDLIFRQFKEEADFNNQILHRFGKESFLYSNKEENDGENNQKKSDAEKFPVVSIFKVSVPDEFDFLWLRSRFSPVSLESISTLNRIYSANEKVSGKTLLIPSFSGLFIPKEPESSFEFLLYKKIISTENKAPSCEFLVDGKSFYFFYGEKFDSTTYAFFLDTNMVVPLKRSILSSDFGYRVSPISGTWKFHSGVDLAAPAGTEVFACKAGEVSETGENSVFGNYISIKHFNGMTSFYAHLSKILVKKGEKVNSGALIGKVGSTGASTGPHLHFEIRQGGIPTNPENHLLIR